MTGKELKILAASIDDDAEVDVTMRIKSLADEAELVTKHIHIKSTCPKEGISIKDIMNKDQIAEFLDEFADPFNKSSIDEALFDYLDSVGVLDELMDTYMEITIE